MVTRDLPKVESGVRFPLPAPLAKYQKNAIVKKIIFIFFCMEGESSTNNKYALWIGAAILVTLVGYAFTRQPAEQKQPETPTQPIEAATTTNNVVITTSTAEIKTSPAQIPTTKPKIAGSATAYQKAVESNSYRFQFSNCHGNPGTLTLKQGVKVMLDNRDAATHTFGFGGAKYTVKGYSFVIVTAPKAGTHYITCDGGGAAQMITQK